MAMPLNPSEFAVAVAVGHGHILDKVLGFVERTSPLLQPVFIVLLALPFLASYHVVVIVAFAIRVAADNYARIVLANGGGDAALVGQAAASLSPVAVLAWFGTTVVKLAIVGALLVFGVLTVALLFRTSAPCSPEITQL